MLYIIKGETMEHFSFDKTMTVYSFQMNDREWNFREKKMFRDLTFSAFSKSKN